MPLNEKPSREAGFLRPGGVERKIEKEKCLSCILHRDIELTLWDQAVEAVGCHGHHSKKDTVMGMLENLSSIYSSNLNAYSKTKDVSLESEKSIRGVFTEALNLRLLAAAEIRLKNDTKSFCARIDRGVRLQKSLLDGYDRGCLISPSFITMTGFHWGLDALAAGDYSLGKEFFAAIGGRIKEERRSDSKFISSIGYATKELALHGKCTNERITEMKKQFSKPSVIGYSMLVEGISIRNKTLAEQGVQEVLKGHRILIRPGGFFSLTPDEIVSFWTLGLLNFAAFVGMKIQVPDSELIPKSLLKVAS